MMPNINELMPGYESISPKSSSNISMPGTESEEMFSPTQQAMLGESSYIASNKKFLDKTSTEVGRQIKRQSLNAMVTSAQGAYRIWRGLNNAFDWTTSELGEALYFAVHKPKRDDPDYEKKFEETTKKGEEWVKETKESLVKAGKIKPKDAPISHSIGEIPGLLRKKVGNLLEKTATHWD